MQIGTGIPALLAYRLHYGMSSDVQVNFIRTELQTAKTMLDLARTEREIGDLEGAAQAIANARKALAAVKRFLPRLRDVKR